ncbi:unnamed protein product [Rhizoctonia solani]|uniref:Uncharacterized protein n=1 Tax=Rhizoctonia solani TaxID=456999 RepID=A0A8H3CCL6_9AGAM|nr:unnamed protein product [Rhizoctonia solani]CAE7119707.1 unnamed protein product [Rhizoctonia solani]
MSDPPRRAIAPHEPQVNTLIAKSRREHALHSRSQRHESTPTTLLSTLALGHQLRVYPRTRAAGPPPPRSWAYPTPPSVRSEVSSGATPNAQWRAHAMRWIFLHLDQSGLIPHSVLHVDEGQSGPGVFAVPTLREMCAQVLVSSLQASGAETQPASTTHEDILDPDLPAHLRRFIVRYSAINSPLSWPALAQLWGIEYGEQGADGEAILVGRDAGGSTFPSSAIKNLLVPAHESGTQSGDDDDHLSWDADDYSFAPPLRAFISIAHPITKHLTLFPPTITHLALIAIPLDRDVTPRIVMSRLSNGLRLLEALDLSCNPWLVADAINAVDWSTRWLRLRFAAFINCRNLMDFESMSGVINGKRNWERAIHIDWA